MVFTNQQRKSIPTRAIFGAPQMIPNPCRSRGSENQPLISPSVAKRLSFCKLPLSSSLAPRPGPGRPPLDPPRGWSAAPLKLRSVTTYEENPGTFASSPRHPSRRKEREKGSEEQEGSQFQTNGENEMKGTGVKDFRSCRRKGKGKSRT
jgi:hypothetical protein